MRSIAVFPAEKNVRLIEEPEPSLLSPTDVKLRMLEVGICGTDREVCAFEYGSPPSQSPYLVVGHESLGGTVLSRETMLKVVPVFVAIMVWVIRVLIIGSFSVTGSRLFSQSPSRQQVHPMARQPQPQTLTTPGVLSTQSAPYRVTHRNDPHPAPKPVQPASPHTEPTYHPMSMSATDHNLNLTRK